MRCDLSSLLPRCRRTLDPAEATAFFIPYDIGFDAAVKKDSAKIRPHGCPHAEAVIALLEGREYFRRNHGYDHFLVQGLNQAMGNFNERSIAVLMVFASITERHSNNLFSWITTGPPASSSSKASVRTAPSSP